MTHEETRKRNKKFIKRLKELDGNIARASREFGFTRERGRQIALHFGVAGTGCRRTKSEDKAIVDKYLAGYKVKSGEMLSSETRVSKGTLFKIRRKLRLPSLRQASDERRRCLSVNTLVDTWIKCNGNYLAMAKELGVWGSVVGKSIKREGLRELCPPQGHVGWPRRDHKEMGEQ